jgi:hypothetical protein
MLGFSDWPLADVTASAAASKHWRLFAIGFMVMFIRSGGGPKRKLEAVSFSPKSLFIEQTIAL